MDDGIEPDNYDGGDKCAYHVGGPKIPVFKEVNSLKQQIGRAVDGYPGIDIRVRLFYKSRSDSTSGVVGFNRLNLGSNLRQNSITSLWGLRQPISLKHAE